VFADDCRQGEELDWFIEHGKVQICKSTDVVPIDEIPPYAWLEKALVDTGVRDIATMEKRLATNASHAHEARRHD
jgi:hypothetical protein